VDTIVLDVGVPGNGWVETNAVDGVYGINSPYSQVVTWSGNSPISGNRIVRTRLGNLKGIGPGTWGWGLFAGDLANGRYAVFSDQSVELHGVPFSMFNGATKVFALDPAVPSMAMGTALPASYSSGDGCWSGMDAGVWKWRCGNPTSGSNLIAWDGSVLSVVGAITVSGTVPDANNALALVGTAGATVVSGAARGALGIDANGLPALPHTATPSGSGLFLGSDYLGYYASGAWKTFMTSAGGFYLGGTGGKLQWDGSALSLEGTVTITGGSGYANLSDKPTLGALAAKSAAAWATDITGIPAPLGTPAGTGLFLSSTNLGYYTGGTWMTYMDNAGKFYLGGTSGKLQWNGSTLKIEGEITVTGGDAATQTYAAAQASAAAAASLDKATFLDTTTIKGGKITTGSITTTQIAATTITASNLNISTLSAITADLGAVTAGSIVVGTTNKLWLNESGDGVLAIGGSTKATAPFRVTAAGSLTATDATLSGSLSAAGGAVTVDSSGITLSEGVGAANKLKWGSAGYIYGNSNSLFLVSETVPVRTTSYFDVWVGGNTILTVDAYGVHGTTLTASAGITVDGSAGITKSFGVDDGDCAGTNRRSLYFKAGILYSADCQVVPAPILATERRPR
jgi:hypothetical protein